MLELQKLREPFLNHWFDLSDFVLPRTGRFTNVRNDMKRAKRNDFSLINNTGTIALDRLKAVLMTGITSPARPWLRFRIKDTALADVKENKVWLEMLQNEFFAVLQSSNFYSIVPGLYEEVALYGTSAIEVVNHDKNLVSFSQLTVGQYVIATNNFNEVDSVFYETAMSVSQMYQEFVYGQEDEEAAEQRLSVEVRKSYTKGDIDQRYTVIRGVFPNDDPQDMQMQAKQLEQAGAMPWKAVAFEPDFLSGGVQNNNEILSTGYFKNFPILVPRWHLLPPDAYGRSPGMAALGDIKTLQEMERVSLEILEKSADPPLMVHTSALEGKIKRDAGEITYAPGDGSNAPVTPLVSMPTASMEMVAQINRIEFRIKEALHADLSSTIENLRPPPGVTGGSRNITATEVNAREREKMLQLSPVMERFDHDFLGPLAVILTQKIIDSGRVPPMPIEMEQTRIEIDYQNIVSVALRDHANKGVIDYINFTSDFAEHPQFSELPMRMNVSLAADKIADGFNVPPDVMYSKEELEQIMEVRQEQEQEQAALAAAKQASEIGANLGKTPGSGGRPMSQEIAEVMDGEPQ